MVSYIIRRTDQGGGWLTRQGSPRTWTKNRASARRFPTRWAAEQERCPDNEVVEEYEP